MIWKVRKKIISTVGITWRSVITISVTDEPSKSQMGLRFFGEKY
jgi:hypothetical protein